MIISILLGGSCGIIIFFIGMVTMSHSITALSSHKLKRVIGLLTTNPLLGILVGTLLTGFTQSSSGTTVLVVSLVNSGAMNLYQATAVIMGSNIGTTFTGQLMAFDSFYFIPHLLMLGVLLYYLNSRTKNIGKFFIGFSFLFLGMKIMVCSLNPLKDLMGFKELLCSIETHPFKGMAMGAVTTALIQSSSTGIIIIQSLAFQGLMNIYQATPIIMGQNIGTCATTIFSSIATDKNGKRTALIHLLFNILGLLILYPFINIFCQFVYRLTPSNPVRQIANAHSLFNLMNTFILLPFIHPIVFTAKKIIR